jgi:hypothetical protein
MAEELDVVALKADRPDLGLKAGESGTIVMLFDDGFCEVEFVDPDDGSTRLMATFSLADLDVVWRIAEHRPDYLAAS